MSIILQFSVVALKGVGGEAASDALKVVVGMLRKRFADNSKRLTSALQKSSGRAWSAAEVALAGSTWWDKCKLVLSTAEQRAFREQIQAFLAAHPLDGVDGHGPNFRTQCLAQLQAARKAGLLDRGEIDPDQLAQQVGDLSRFGDRTGVVEAEYQKLSAAADILRKHGYDALAAFVELRPASGPPLLLSAMRYFFQREVESDRELFQGLAYARLESLSEGQQSGFAGLADSLDQHADQLQHLLADVQAILIQTRGDVLDIKAEMARQGKQMQELGDAVLKALSQHQLERRELHGQDSMSIRDEDERRLVKDLVKRYRALPGDQRKQMPALLNAVGKLQVVAGDFESAERDFRELATMVPDATAKAEVAYNTYRAALERRAWDEALASLKDALTHDAGRFAPFPVNKFEPDRILGAGGFGVAFLCRNRHSGAQVVIKTLRRDGLERDLSEVFREAQALEGLEHPAIIRVRDCDYADAQHTRPYLVMDYFAGYNLAEHVEKHGAIPTRELLPLVRMVAEGLQKAHGKGILHRDVKPANLLVRRVGSGWDAKLIDFGLALRANTVQSTLKASMDRTLLGSSIAGTIEYAAPEQMGKLKGVAVGTYSDVYGFAKTCCFALFGTPQPTYQHWQQIPRELADLLGRCLTEQPKGRPQDFAQVLGELDRLLKPREVPIPVNVPRVLPEVVPVLDAQPVEERPRRVESPKPRREEPRYEEPRRKRVEERPEPRPVRPAAPPRRSKVPLVLVTLLLLGAGAGAAWYFGLLGKGQTNPSGTGYGLLSKEKDKTIDPFGWPKQVETKYEPIGAAEFPAILKTLRGKPTDDALKQIAGRLAETEPTEKQKKAHAVFETRREMWKQPVKGCSPEAWKEAQQNSDILAVSRALNPLCKTTDLQAQKNVTRALMKWGTEDNVDGLIKLTEASSYGADVVRIWACKALSRIPDQEGANAVAARLESPWPPERTGVNEALRAYQDKRLAENAVFYCLRGTVFNTNHITGDRKAVSYDSSAKQEAIKLLEEIGTAKSIPELENLLSDGWCKNAARKAIDAINAREGKQKSKS